MGVYFDDEEGRIANEMVRCSRGAYKMHNQWKGIPIEREIDKPAENIVIKPRKIDVFYCRKDILKDRDLKLITKIVLCHLISIWYVSNGEIIVSYRSFENNFGATWKQVDKAFKQLINKGYIEMKYLREGLCNEDIFEIKLKRKLFDRYPDMKEDYL